MDLQILILLLTLLPLLLIKAISKTRKVEKPKLPPGPAKLPIIGNLHQLQYPLHRYFYHLSKHHGPLMHFQLGSNPTLIVSSADMAKELLKTHDLDCCSRPSLSFTDKLSYNGSDVAFAPYSKNWRDLRKICIIELFSIKKVSSFRRVREKEIGNFIALISNLADSSNPLNLSEKLISLANSVACRIALGRSYRKDSKYDINWLTFILSERQRIAMSLFMADVIPWLGWVDLLTGMDARLRKIFLEFDNFYEDVIRERMGQLKQEGDRVEDILDTLLEIRENSSKQLHLENIKGILMNIFIGGTETTSSLIEWAIAELIKNPEIMKKAQEEVRRVVGRKCKVDESDIIHLKYLNLILKETLRLHPPAPLLLQRQVMRRFKVDEYEIEPKTRIIINAWAISRDATYWEKPEEFYPERFMHSSVDVKGQDFQLIPFGSGRRMCPGMNLGLATVELTLANLIYAFDWALQPEMTKVEFDMEEVPGLTTRKKIPLLLTATKYTSMEG